MSFAIQNLNQPQIIQNYPALKQDQCYNQPKTSNNISFTSLIKTGGKVGCLIWEVFNYLCAIGALGIGLLIDTHRLDVGNFFEPVQKTIFSLTDIHVSPSWAAYGESIWSTILAIVATKGRRRLSGTK